MGRFRFQFEAVERFRRAGEERALSALGAAQRKYQLEAMRKFALQKALASALSRREAIGESPASSTDFELEERFITGTKQRIVQADQVIVRASRGVEKALRAYIQAKRQLKMIETLRERAFAQFKKELAKKEQRAADDLTVMRMRLRENDLIEQQEEGVK